MPISVTLGGQQHSVYRRTIEDLVLHGKDVARQNFSAHQERVDSFYSFLGAGVRSFMGLKTNAEILDELDQLIRPSSQDVDKSKGADIVTGLATVSEAKNDNPQLFDFLGRLKIKVENRGTGSDVEMSIQGKGSEHKKSHQFAAPVVLPNQLFDSNSISGVYHLKSEAVRGEQLQAYAVFLNFFKVDERDQVIKIMNDLPHAPASRDFEASILKLNKLVEDGKEKEFHQQFQLKVVRTDNSSVAQICFDDLKGFPPIEIRFDGEYKPNDQLFDLDAEASNTSVQIFKKKEINVNSSLRLPVDMIADQNIYSNELRMYEDVLNMTLSDTQFGQISTRDLHGTIEWLPDDSDTEDKDILTKQKYSNLIQGHFRNDVELQKLESDSEKAFYRKFNDLSTGDKNAFIKGLETNKLSGALQSLHSEFLAFGSAEQARLKQTFFGVDSHHRYYGTIEQFKEKFSTLPNQVQALIAIATEQYFKKPSDIAGDYFVRRGPHGEQLLPCPTTYAFKALPANSQNPMESRIEMKKNLNFRHCNDRSDKPTILVSDESTNIYVVSFKTNQQLVDANVTLSDSTSKLVIHNSNGSIPENCKRAPTEEAKSLNMSNVDNQLQRQRVQLQLVKSEFYNPIAGSQASYPDLPF